MEQVEQLEQGGTPCRNTKHRAWCFTWNNYNEESIEFIKTFDHYHFGEEVAGTGTPHLQGVIKFTNPRSFRGVKTLLKECHIEPCRNWNASINYCSKEGKIHSNLKRADRPLYISKYDEYMEKKYSNVTWKKWQQDIIDIVNSEPDERKVYWYWEYEGNRGKTFLAKWLDWKHNAIIANGKQSDIYNQYAKFTEETKDQPTLAIIDIPRSHKDYVCYSTMEKIKDGLVYSGKYEGTKLRLIPHHLIIFANFKPDKEKLSEDRWVIKEILDE